LVQSFLTFINPPTPALFSNVVSNPSLWQSVVNTEKFHLGGYHSVGCGGNLYLVCAVCDFTIYRHIHVFKPMFWRSLLTQYAYSSTCTLLVLCVIALNINYQCSKLGYRRKI